ncbi:MAG: zinc ABC transporter ATP-binding protein ZnuC [Gammaproteobacteria bacterium]|jgi:zinc transport system ATP-binding protein|nr:zinc ABC transporter ATP-binding protein ZnuC [Gammaproteobacteria bacterium]
MAEGILSARGLMVKRNRRKLIHDVSLDLQAGQITTLIGPNGAGKSTLVRTLLGLQKASAGTITKRPDLRVGYMPQKLNLESTLPLRVQRFIDLGLGKHRLPKNLLQAMFQACRIEHLLTQPMQYLSGGETQRVLLLRSLLNSPHLLILDEPVQGVDIAGQADMYQLIVNIRDQLGCGILMISHDLHMVAAATDQVICLNQHVCCSGHPQQVSQDPAIVELFGNQGVSALAVYNHQHNHHHDSQGTIIPGHHHGGCEHD